MTFKRHSQGCAGSVTLSPGKTNVNKKCAHSCLPISNSEIAVKIATQNLKQKIADPQNAGQSVLNMFNTMQSRLVTDQGMTYETVAQIVKPFQKQSNGFYKKKAKMEQRGMIAMENFNDVTTNDNLLFFILFT